MKTLQIAIALMISLALLGCSQKAQQQAESSSSENTVKTEAIANAAVNNAPEAQPSADASDKTQKTDESAKEPNCAKVPDTASIEKIKSSWGYIQKTTWDMGKILTVYDEIPVFTEPSDANKRINAALAREHDEFAKGIGDAWELSCGFNPDEEDHHDYKLEATVDESDKLITVNFVRIWYMGGRTEFDEYSLKFRKDTGESQNSLKNFYSMSDDALKSMIKKSFKQHLNEIWESTSGDADDNDRKIEVIIKPEDQKRSSWKDYDDEQSDAPSIDWKRFNDMPIEDFDIYFKVKEDGSVYIHLNEGKLTDIVKDADDGSFFAYDSIDFKLLEKSDLYNNGK